MMAHGWVVGMLYWWPSGWAFDTLVEVGLALAWTLESSSGWGSCGQTPNTQQWGSNMQYNTAQNKVVHTGLLVYKVSNKSFIQL